MAKKGFLSVRIDDETLSDLDKIAERSQQSRSEAIRTLIAVESYGLYQVMQDASRGEFSAAFLTYLVSIISDPGLDIVLLREWLHRNPYHQKAPMRVRAVVAHHCPDLFPKVSADAKRLEGLAGTDSLEKEYEEFMSEETKRVSHGREEDTENDD